MWYLYGVKAGQSLKLIATFDTDVQLMSYVSEIWSNGEAKSVQDFNPLNGFRSWQTSDQPLNNDLVTTIPHNPLPPRSQLEDNLACDRRFAMDERAYLAHRLNWLREDRERMSAATCSAEVRSKNLVEIDQRISEVIIRLRAYLKIPPS